MDRGAWWATVHGVTKELDTTEQLTLSLFQRYHGCPAACLLLALPPVSPLNCLGPPFWLTSYLGVGLSLLLCKMGMITVIEL